MNSNLSPREIEQLSSLLDETLPLPEATRLRARLEREPALREVYEQMRQGRSLLRRLPARRAPHNFTLKRNMVGVRPPAPRLFPAFQWSAAFSAALFLLTWGWNGLMGGGAAFGAAAPLAASAPQAEAPLAAEPLPTEESLSIMAAPEETPAPEMRILAPKAQPTALLFAAPPAEAGGAESDPSAKSAPATEAPPAGNPSASMSPLTLLFGGLTLLLLAAAWSLRWRAEYKFRQGK